MKAPDLAAPLPRAAASGEPTRRERADAVRAEGGADAPFESFLRQPVSPAPTATAPANPAPVASTDAPSAPAQPAVPPSPHATLVTSEAAEPAPEPEVAETPPDTPTTLVLPEAILTAPPQTPAAKSRGPLPLAAADPRLPPQEAAAPVVPSEVTPQAAEGLAPADRIQTPSGPHTRRADAKPDAAATPAPATVSALPIEAAEAAPDPAAPAPAEGYEANAVEAAAAPAPGRPSPEATRAATPAPAVTPPQHPDAAAAESTERSEAVEPTDVQPEPEPRRASERIPAPYSSAPAPAPLPTAADPRQTLPAQNPANPGLAATLTQAGGDWRLDTAPGPGATRADPPLPAGIVPQAVSEQITLAIGRGRDRRIEIRLDPPELGRVQIQLSRTENGLHAVVLADRPETQEFLRRNADQLIQDLDGAGYGEVQLDFAAGGQSAPRDEDRRQLRASYAPAAIAAATTAEDRPQPRHAGLSGLDIRL